MTKEYLDVQPGSEGRGSSLDSVMIWSYTGPAFGRLLFR